MVSETPVNESVTWLGVHEGIALRGSPVTEKATNCGAPVIVKTKLVLNPCTTCAAEGPVMITDGIKFASTVPGLFMVAKVACEDGVVIAIDPVAVHPLKAYPAFAVADIATVAPAFSHPLAGSTPPDPEGSAAIESVYW